MAAEKAMPIMKKDLMPDVQEYYTQWENVPPLYDHCAACKAATGLCYGVKKGGVEIVCATCFSIGWKTVNKIVVLLDDAAFKSKLEEAKFWYVHFHFDS